MNPDLFNPLDSDNEFIKNYRESLKQAYDAGVAQLENQRNLDRGAIAGQAAKAGVLFSNIPQRMQTQYDTQTYMPALASLRSGYQTGLDAIRSNSLNALNQMRYYQEMINHYNTLPTSNSGGTSGTDAIAQAIKNAMNNNNAVSTAVSTVPKVVGMIPGITTN